MSSRILRRSKTGFGICDLPQKSTTKAKFRTLGLNWDFLGPFWDLSGTFSRYFHEIAKKMRNGQKTCCRDISLFKLHMIHCVCLNRAQQ